MSEPLDDGRGRRHLSWDDIWTEWIMPTWNHGDWTSQNPDIDAEHHKLHQMIASLNAVVMRDSGLGLQDEAIEILIERMRLHFNLEEISAGKVDPEACAILKEDHARLLGLLAQVRATMVRGEMDACRTLLRRFNEELSKHDTEIDIPLFRMMAKAQSNRPH